MTGVWNTVVAVEEKVKGQISVIRDKSQLGLPVWSVSGKRAEEKSWMWGRNEWMVGTKWMKKAWGGVGCRQESSLWCVLLGDVYETG